MQDNWKDINARLKNLLPEFEELTKMITPNLVDIQENAEKVDPELMAMYNKEMEKLKAETDKLESLKVKMQNFKL